MAWGSCLQSPHRRAGLRTEASEVRLQIQKSLQSRDLAGTGRERGAGGGGGVPRDGETGFPARLWLC